MLRRMSGNTFGTLFAVTNFGESHGPAIGCVIDGCPPGMELSEADIQPDLDRRRPGTSRHVTQRQEADKVEILSGVYEGRTTGTPICLLIRNTDQRSKDYSEIARSSAPATPTTPTCRSTACATRAAAAAPRPA
jgi:chorismate synthase